jgi:hypothetical protein
MLCLVEFGSCPCQVFRDARLHRTTGQCWFRYATRPSALRLRRTKQRAGAPGLPTCMSNCNPLHSTREQPPQFVPDQNVAGNQQLSAA